MSKWHITLGFYGDGDDPVRRVAWLRGPVRDHPAPTLRLTGAGTFGSVLWAGVRAHDERRLTRLARAAGADRSRYRPHLTLGRLRSGAPEMGALTEPLTGYSGPWFTPDAVVLLRSENHSYTTVERLPLASA